MRYLEHTEFRLGPHALGQHIENGRVRKSEKRDLSWDKRRHQDFFEGQRAVVVVGQAGTYFHRSINATTRYGGRLSVSSPELYGPKWPVRSPVSPAR